MVMPGFKRSLSLVKQVKAHLQQQIRANTFAGERMPPEADLAASLGVSRNTVRDALSQLEAEGVINRRQGAGTFIRQAGLLVKTRLEEITPYDQLITAHGYTAAVRLLAVTEIPASPAIAARLNCVPNTACLEIKKLFLADDRPVIFTLTYIPPGIITQPYTHNDLKAPVFRFIPGHCEQGFAYYVTEIVPLLAQPWLAELLQLPAENSVLVSFEETGYNQADEPIVLAYSYFRDDLLRLRMVRRLAL
jgi:GntR family transcriptional regulator